MRRCVGILVGRPYSPLRPSDASRGGGSTGTINQDVGTRKDRVVTVPNSGWTGYDHDSGRSIGTVVGACLLQGRYGTVHLLPTRGDYDRRHGRQAARRWTH